MGFKVVFESVE